MQHLSASMILVSSYILRRWYILIKLQSDDSVVNIHKQLIAVQLTDINWGNNYTCVWKQLQ